MSTEPQTTADEKQKSDCNCKQEKQIINKKCLKEKLEEWLGKKLFWDLLIQSGFDIMEIAQMYDNSFEELSQDRLLFTIRNIFIKKYRDQVSQRDWEIIKVYNECFLIDPSYTFGEYGILIKPENTSFMSIQTQSDQIDQPKMIKFDLKKESR